MSKVITFSRTFPSYHSRKGQQTDLIQKIWKSLLELDQPIANYIYDVGKLFDYEYADQVLKVVEHSQSKHHTIRAGHRWKVGDWFSPRVWGNDVNPKSGRSGPYHSKQIIIAPDIEIKKIWTFEIKKQDDSWNVILNGINIYFESPTSLGGSDKINWIPSNDGLSKTDFFDWFKWTKKEFSGQIICWNEKIQY